MLDAKLLECCLTCPAPVTDAQATEAVVSRKLWSLDVCQQRGNATVLFEQQL